VTRTLKQTHNRYINELTVLDQARPAQPGLCLVLVPRRVRRLSARRGQVFRTGNRGKAGVLFCYTRQEDAFVMVPYGA